MKATARKIKDNEWIAEVTEHYGGNMFEQGQQTEQYPIVSPSDKEWLEKNNMDGKEMEGDVCKLPEDDIFFQLTTPPIHSDPAGEEVGAIEVIKRAYAESQKLSFGEITSKQVHEGYLIANEMQDILGIYLEGEHKLWKESFRQPPTPPTGRTYTEQDMIEFATRCTLSYCHPLTGKKTVTDQLKGFNEYLKQKPKP